MGDLEKGSAEQASESVQISNDLGRVRTAEYASKFSLLHRSLIVLMTSWTTLATTFSSTTMLILTEEVSRDLHVSQNTLLINNGLVLFVMGCSSFFWGPIGKIVGYRTSWNLAVFVLCLNTLGTALAPTASVFMAFRILAAVQGTYFHVAGQTIIADIFEPVHRGTATGFFTAGTILGPPLGPCVAGIMVTFTHWRNVFWLQFAMVGSCFALSMCFFPIVRKAEFRWEKDRNNILVLLKYFNILHVFRPMLNPNVLLPQITCGLLSWSQYTLLAAPRHIINPRFHLTTPLVSGLFYLAPGAGFLLGTIIGGKFSDMTVVRWIEKRGHRLPQDRLRSGLLLLFTVVPVSAMIYGWGLQEQVGGLPLPVVSAFFWAAGLLATFASLNTYCGEILPKQRGEVIAGKYVIQYSCSAIASAAIIPLIDAVQIGPASSIGLGLVLIGGMFTLIITHWGLAIDTRRNSKAEKIRHSNASAEPS